MVIEVNRLLRCLAFLDDKHEFSIFSFSFGIFAVAQASMLLYMTAEIVAT